MAKEFKILNLYAGVGGNRKLWPTHIKETPVRITAVEKDESIATIYKGLYPDDEVIVDDAHECLRKTYREFDYIWSSPPCVTHSVTNHFLHAQGHERYPDLKLYEEIIFLKTWCKGKYTVENVKAFYEPLVKPQVSGRHWFWANFKIPYFKDEAVIGRMAPVKSGKERGSKYKDGRTQGLKTKDVIGIDLKGYSHPRKDKLLRNCVPPHIGLAILESAIGIYRQQNPIPHSLFSASSLEL